MLTFEKMRLEETGHLRGTGGAGFGKLRIFRLLYFLPT